MGRGDLFDHAGSVGGRNAGRVGYARPVRSGYDLRRALPWMAGWLTLMTVIAVAGREATRTLPVWQVMELRSLIGLVLLYPLVRAAGGFAAMRTSRLRQHAARNTVHYLAQAGWFFALGMIPLAQVVAIEFTMPIWTAALAVAFLGERIDRAKLLAIGLGLVGVGIIVRPAAAGLNAGQLIALAAAVGFAVSVTMTKSLTRTDNATVIMFWMLAVQAVLGLVPAALSWRAPDTGVIGWVLLVAFCGTFSHYCMARAMRHAEATVLVPIDFLRVPLTALTGWAIYGERLDLLTVVGTALVLAGNLANLGSRRGGKAGVRAESRAGVGE
jgi:drug/metabolite transporter (DMT)-like permease